MDFQGAVYDFCIRNSWEKAQKIDFLYDIWYTARKQNRKVSIVPELDFQFKDIMQMEHPELILKKARPFMDLMMEYQCALMEVETKLNVLNEEFAAKYQRNPFESIKSRIKEP